LGAIAIGGGAIYLATRGSHEAKDVAMRMPAPQHEVVPAKVETPTPVEKAPVIEKTPEPPTEKVPDKLVVKAPDKPPAKAPDKPSAKAATKPVAEATKPEESATDEGEDESVKQRLADAEAAYRAGDLAKVERITNAIIAGDAGRPAAKGHAHSLHGIVQCALHNSEEQARIDLRQLASFPKQRQRLLSACRAEGHLTSD
ncbi:MAG TPA: hypothetical protein VIV58_26680, partial [Kofleriaceae bacterium]